MGSRRQRHPREGRRLDRAILRRRWRPHDMFEPTDYDFPDDQEVEEWMIARVTDNL
jgi:hypothetical protein